MLNGWTNIAPNSWDTHIYNKNTITALEMEWSKNVFVNKFKNIYTKTIKTITKQEIIASELFHYHQTLHGRLISDWFLLHNIKSTKKRDWSFEPMVCVDSDDTKIDFLFRDSKLNYKNSLRHNFPSKFIKMEWNCRHSNQILDIYANSHTHLDVGASHHNTSPTLRIYSREIHCSSLSNQIPMLIYFIGFCVCLLSLRFYDIGK